MIWKSICCLVSVLLLCPGVVAAESVKFTVHSGSGSSGSDGTTDLLVESGKGLGAFQMNLSYDPALIELKNVEPATGVNALIDFNILTPGTARIAFASSSGVVSDGAVLQILWKVKAEGTSPITLSELRAWEQATSFELPVVAGSSEFRATPASSAADPPSTPGASKSTPGTSENGSFLTIMLGLGVGAVIAILLLIFVLKKRVMG